MRVMQIELISLKRWLVQKGRSRIWAYRQRKKGLPVKSINGMVYVILPDAEEWLLGQAGPAHPGLRAGETEGASL